MKSERDILVKGMSKVIDIPIDILNIVIEGNKCAKEFLELEKALSLTGDIKNLKTLNRILLFREDYDDLTRLKERDIKFIKENYLMMKIFYLFLILGLKMFYLLIR